MLVPRAISAGHGQVKLQGGVLPSAKIEMEFAIVVNDTLNILC
jgi:hypothetical protein